MNRPSLIQFETMYGHMSHRALREYFQAIGQYADELEKEVKKYKQKYDNTAQLERDTWNGFVECNGALNIACKALADYSTPVIKGNTAFCSTKSEDYYRFLLEGAEE